MERFCKGEVLFWGSFLKTIYCPAHYEGFFLHYLCCWGIILVRCSKDEIYIALQKSYFSKNPQTESIDKHFLIFFFISLTGWCSKKKMKIQFFDEDWSTYRQLTLFIHTWIHSRLIVATAFHSLTLVFQPIQNWFPISSLNLAWIFRARLSNSPDFWVHRVLRLLKWGEGGGVPWGGTLKN